MLTLIAGPPREGKTTLALAANTAARAEHLEGVILDPRRDGRWDPGPGGFVTDDPEEFLAGVLSRDRYGNPLSTKLFVVVDEVDWNDGEWKPCVTQLVGQFGHHGHTVILISHAYTQFPTAARASADRLYLFRASASNAKLAADDWALDAFRMVPSLPKHEALWADRREPQVYRYSDGSKVWFGPHPPPGGGSETPGKGGAP